MAGYDDDIDDILGDPFGLLAVIAFLLFGCAATIPYFVTGYPWKYEGLAFWLCAPFAVIGAIGFTIRAVLAHLTERQIEDYRSSTQQYDWD